MAKQVFFFVGSVVGDSGFPGNFEVIPIAYAMVENVSLITLLFQHSTLASKLGIAVGGGVLGIGSGMGCCAFLETLKSHHMRSTPIACS